MEKHIIGLNNIIELGKDYGLCIGTFDGVHLGHQELLKRVIAEGKKPAVMIVYTNSNLKKHSKSGYLTSLEDREAIFSKLGVEHLLLLQLSDEIKCMTPEAFIDKIIKKINPSLVVVGQDFRYGKKAEGNIELLATYHNDFALSVVVPVMISRNVKISTTKLKYYLSIGRLDKANKYLTRPYTVVAPIEYGYQLGGKIGYPTANLDVKDTYFVPKRGVYFAAVRLEEKNYYAMVSIGVHPSVNKLKKEIIEVHIFDFAKNIYNKIISVEFLQYLRKEIKFDSLDELINQIKEDEKQCYLLIKERAIYENN